MRKIYLLLLFLIPIFPALAQTSDLDELPLPLLKQKLAVSKSDTNRVNLLLAIGHLIVYKPGGGSKEIDSTLTFAAEAEKLSRKINYDDGIYNAMLLAAEGLTEKKEREKALKISQQALAFCQKTNNINGMAKSYLMIGRYYQVAEPSGIHARIKYNYKAIQLFRKAGNMHWMANTLANNAELYFLTGNQTDAIKLLFETLNIGDGVSPRTVEGIYWLIGRTSTELGDYPNALKYNLLAIKTASQVGDTSLLLCSVYHNTAFTYVKMQDYDRAIPYAVKALQIARHYRDKAYISTVCGTLAIAFTRTNKLAQALALLREVKSYAKNDVEKLDVASALLSNLTYARKFKRAGIYAQEVKDNSAKVPAYNFSVLMAAYNSLAHYYLETGQPEPARYYSDLYAGIVHQKNIPAGIRTAELRYYQLDSLRGNFKSAVNHYLIAQKIKDSTDNVTKAYQISLLQIENETEQKNKDINALTKQAEIKEAQLRRNHLVQELVIAACIVLLIITALIYSRYRLKQRSTTLLMQQKSEIDKQNISLQHLVDDKDLLLKEVNHRVKNNLQIVMSLLESQSGFMQNEKAQEAILNSQNRVQAIALIHDTLYNTNKIAEIELSPYINDLIQSLDDSINKGRDKVQIRCDVDDILLDVSQAIPVGIILNESVTNALKYAFPGERTGEISVDVKQAGMNIEMRISDDGIGLPEGFNLIKANSLGITLITGLTSQLKGTFDIHYRSGVTIIVKFAIEIAAMTSTASGVA